MTKLTVQLLVWNGEKYLPHLFESLRNQTSHDWQIYIMDNSSTDNSVSIIEKELEQFSFPYFFEKGESNLGFAGGHNYIYEQTDTDYVLFLNQDLFLETDCLEKLVNFLEINKEAAVASPRLMYWDFTASKFTNLIDSLGLKIYHNRRVVDWMNGRDWEVVKEQIIKLSNNLIIETFGVSGTCPMFRRSVLEEIAFTEGIFDENYGSYKEDVDLAWRLRSAGYKSFIILDICAYHDRSSNYQDKKNQPKEVRYNSYKNHLMTLYKNEYWQNFILDFFWILWYELRKFFWFLFYDREILVGLREVWALINNIRDKRYEIKNKRKVDWLEIRQWFK